MEIVILVPGQICNDLTNYQLDKNGSLLQLGCRFVKKKRWIWELLHLNERRITIPCQPCDEGAGADYGHKISMS